MVRDEVQSQGHLADHGTRASIGQNYKHDRSERDRVGSELIRKKRLDCLTSTNLGGSDGICICTVLSLCSLRFGHSDLSFLPVHESDDHCFRAESDCRWLACRLDKRRLGCARMIMIRMLHQSHWGFANALHAGNTNK